MNRFYNPIIEHSLSINTEAIQDENSTEWVVTPKYINYAYDGYLCDDYEEEEDYEDYR